MTTLTTKWTEVPIRELMQPLQDGKLVHQGWSPQCESGPALSESDWGALKTTAIQDGSYEPEHNKRLPETLEPKVRLEVNAGDLLMTCAGPRVRCGVACLVRETPPKRFISGKMYRFRANEALIDSRLLEAFLRTPSTKAQIDAMKTGISESGMNITHEKFSQLIVPIAPRAEQKRIADKLDTVLTRVDAVNTRLARVAPLLKRFRQSVLAAATSGRLTEDWRTANGSKPATADSLKKVPLPSDYKRLSKQSFKSTKIPFDATDLPASWLTCTIGELYESNVLVDFADGNHGSLYPRKEEFDLKGALFLTATQMSDSWEIDLLGCPRLNADKAMQLTKGWAKHGDLLLSHNATVGRVGVLDSPEEDVLLGTSVTFYRFNPNYFSARFGRIVFSSLFFQDQLRSVMTQTTRDQVPITKQVSLNLVVPPFEEQTEIVRRVETLFAFADRLEVRLVQAQTAATRLTPALLAKAFRGELVPQDPNDEPAVDLLRRLAHGSRAKGVGMRGLNGTFEVSR